MLTSTHRWADDAALASFLPTQATTGGIDFTRYFADRAWVLEASGVASHVTGDPAAILALQTNAVHYYQRPDASHLGVDPNATSLSGHGGSVRFGRSDTSRLRLTDHFHWYSPGLELNDVGYLRQADVIANQVFLGWSEPTPRGIFRSYSVQLAREDQWDFGGLETRSATELEASGQFKNKWARRGEPRLRGRGGHADAAGRARPALARLLRGGAGLAAATTRGGSRLARTAATPGRATTTRGPGASGASLQRPAVEPPLALRVDLVRAAARQPAVRRHRRPAAEAPRWVLGRIDQDTWNFTFRVNLSITPDLTVQYYGSPFIGTGRYTAFKRATDTLAPGNADRFHLYGPDEIAYSAGGQRLPGDGGRRRPLLLLRATPTSASGSSARTSSRAGSAARARRSTSSGRRGARRYAPEWDASFCVELGRAARGTRPTTSSSSSSATGSRPDRPARCAGRPQPRPAASGRPRRRPREGSLAGVRS